MEAALKRQDCVVRAARCLIVHAGGKLLCRRWDYGSTTLPLRIVDHCDFVGGFIGTSAAHGGCDTVHAWRGHGHESIVVDVVHLLYRVNTDASSRRHSHPHELSVGQSQHLWMIVAHCIGANRREQVKHLVAIRVANHIAQTVGKIDREVCLQRASVLTHLLDKRLCLWCRKFGQDLGLRLVREGTCTSREFRGLARPVQRLQ